MQNAGLNEAQAGLKISGRNIINFRYADDSTLMVESKEELKNLSMKVKEESEKVGLKLYIQKPKIMAPSPVTSWQENGITVEIEWDFTFFFFGGGWAPKSLHIVTEALKLKDAFYLEEKLWPT